MVTEDEARALALALPEASESAHFENVDFRIRNKIFASFPGVDTMGLRLTPEHQSVLVAEDPEVFRAPPNYWGRQGWTMVTLSKADPDQLADLLADAWRRLAPKKLIAAYDADQAG